MTARITFSVLILAFLGCNSSYAQDQTAASNEGSTTITIKSIEDPDGTPWTTYVETAQFFPTVSLRLIVAEAAVVNDNEETQDLVWDHPLADELVSPYLPLYKYNSLESANEPITRPFILTQGSRLTMFRDIGFRFPLQNEDGRERDFNADTAGLTTPESVTFVIEILDAKTREVLAAVDRHTIPACGNWTSFSRAMLGAARDIAALGTNEPYLAAFDPPAALHGRPIMLRISAVCGGQEQERFTERALYCRFQQSPRITPRLRAGWDDAMRHVQRATDSLIAAAPLPKAGYPAGTINRDFDLLVYPTTLSTLNASLRVFDARMRAGDAVSLVCVDLAGRVLHEDVRVSSGATDLEFAVPPGLSAQEYFIAFVRRGTAANYTLVRIAE